MSLQGLSGSSGMKTLAGAVVKGEIKPEPKKKGKGRKRTGGDEEPNKARVDNKLNL